MYKRLLSIVLFALFLFSSTFAQVVINEINYHSPDNSDSGDWVELVNSGNSTVDISGWMIKDSNDDNTFTFEANTSLDAGAYIVAVRDTERFDAIFPGITNRVGGIDFNFSNGGELIRLFDDLAALVDQVEYDDEGDWPTEPDGNGSTLELRDPALDNSLAASWGASGGSGTPGKQNSLLVSNEEEGFSPTKFSLSQNYPNPFNPSTNISYSISRSGKVKLEVFNVLGKRVAILVNGTQGAGNYDIQFNATGIPSGIYIYQLTSGNQVTRNRMTLIK